MLGMEAGAKMVAWGQSWWEGPGHQEELPPRPQAATYLTENCPSQSGPLWAPGSVRSRLWSLPQSPIPDHCLRTVRVLPVPVRLAHWRTVLASSSACSVLLAGACLELLLTGGCGQTRGAGPSRGRWYLLGSAPGTTARGQDMASARPVPARGECSVLRQDAQASSSSQTLQLWGQGRSGHRCEARDPWEKHEWTLGKRVGPRVDTRNEGYPRNCPEGAGRRRWERPGSDQAPGAEVAVEAGPRRVPAAADWGPHCLQVLGGSLHRMGAERHVGGLGSRTGPTGRAHGPLRLGKRADPQSPDTAPSHATHSSTADVPRDTADVRTPSMTQSQAFGSNRAGLRIHIRIAFIEVEVCTPRPPPTCPVAQAPESPAGSGGGPSHGDVSLGSSGKAVGCMVIFRGGNITALKPHNLLPHPAGARGAGGSAVPPLPHAQPQPLPGGQRPPELSWKAGQAQGRGENADGTDGAAHTIHLQVVGVGWRGLVSPRGHRVLTELSSHFLPGMVSGEGWGGLRPLSSGGAIADQRPDAELGRPARMPGRGVCGGSLGASLGACPATPGSSSGSRAVPPGAHCRPQG